MFVEDNDNDLFENLPQEQEIPENVPSHEQVITFDWTPEEKFRAKLYQLDTDGRWQDLGTGYFGIKLKEDEPFADNE